MTDPTTPTLAQMAAWLDAVAGEADDLPPPYEAETRGEEKQHEDGVRRGLRLAAEHLRSEHCATQAARIHATGETR
jgi:hypothetical protein